MTNGGVPLITILEIAGNYPEDIIVEAGGPSKENGKYAGWITRGDGHNYKPLLSSEAIFDTPELAKKAMQEIVDECIKIADKTMKDKSNPLTQFLSSDEGQAVKEVVRLAKSGIPL